MAIVLGSLVAAFAALLLIGALTGRVKVKSCCAVADPRKDLRMRAAFSADDPAETSERGVPGRTLDRD